MIYKRAGFKLINPAAFTPPRPRVCECCDTKKNVTRHHIRPRRLISHLETGKQKKYIYLVLRGMGADCNIGYLCRDCHDIIELEYKKIKDKEDKWCKHISHVAKHKSAWNRHKTRKQTYPQSFISKLKDSRQSMAKMVEFYDRFYRKKVMEIREEKMGLAVA